MPSALPWQQICQISGVNGRASICDNSVTAMGNLSIQPKENKRILRVVGHLKESKYCLVIFSRASKTTELYLIIHKINKYLSWIWITEGLFILVGTILERALQAKFCTQKCYFHWSLPSTHYGVLSFSKGEAFQRCPDCRKECSNKGKMPSFLLCPTIVLKKLKFNSAKHINLQIC